ncbi:hypothetical protein VTK26DRAFT_7823 [Humicola hyalothermophila]
MSVLSMIKRGRQAAKQHRAEQAEKEKREAEKPPYKHIPKHAAIDALSGGPAGWREYDRQRILEQNRRRSALTASGVGMSGMMTPVHAGMPRVHSSLSHVSYPTAYANPVVQLPRNYSYSSMPPGWTHHPREVNYSPVDIGPVSPKGKEVERIMGGSSRTSRSSSKVSASRIPLPPFETESGDMSLSPADSSSNSTSSQDDLEMRPVRHSAAVPPSASAMRRNRATSETERVHRLHPGHSRRMSDSNQNMTSSRNSATPRTISLAPGVPPVPALPPTQVGTAVTTSEVSSSAASAASSVTMVPVASSASFAAVGHPDAAPTVVAGAEFDGTQHVPSAEVSCSEEDALPAKPEAPKPAPIASAVSHAPSRKKGRRISKMTRFAGLETIESDITIKIEPNPHSPKEEAIAAEDEKQQPTSSAAPLPASFDEESLQTSTAIALPEKTSRPSKPSKLSKTAKRDAKLVKKNRWSLGSSKSAAVAG